jgi:hypothetical protein
MNMSINVNINKNKHILNVINETKEQIENIETQRVQLLDFYTENKDKENNYELVKTFFDKTIFIQRITTDMFSCFINDENDNYESFLSYYKHSCDYPTVVDFDQKGKENLKLICDEEEMKLNFKMVLLEHKLKYYENLIWKNKITLVISSFYSLFQRLNTCVNFLIPTVIAVVITMISILILHCIIYQLLNTAVMTSRAQCVQCTQ